MTSAPDQELEFSYLMDVSSLEPEGESEHLSASEDQCLALAARFGVIAIHSLEADIHVHPWKRGGFRARGTAKAQIRQTCVVSLDDFDSDLSVDLDRIFVAPNTRLATADGDIVVSIEDDDIGEVVEGEIELGEFAVEELLLGLDPYPRKPGVTLEQASYGPAETDNDGPESGRSNPFSVLKDLKLKDKQ